MTLLLRNPVLPHYAPASSSNALYREAKSLEEIGGRSIIALHATTTVVSADETAEHLDPVHLEEDEDDSDAVATQKREALDPNCDVFLKIR